MILFMLQITPLSFQLLSGNQYNNYQQYLHQKNHLVMVYAENALMKLCKIFPMSDQKYIQAIPTPYRQS